MIVIVTRAETEHCQCNTGLTLFLDKTLERIHIGGADVKVAIGGEYHTVNAVFDQVLSRQVVGELDSSTAVG